MRFTRCEQNRLTGRESPSPWVGPQASLYPVAPGTLFHETTAALVLTADTFKMCTALLSTDICTEIGSRYAFSHLIFPVPHLTYQTITTHAHILVFQACTLVTCLDSGCGNGSLSVSEDGVNGNGVLGAHTEALDHVEVERVPEVNVLYVAV